MKETKKIADNIYYIGVDDDTLDLFESQYPVADGVSYNSYVIMDDEIVIMDTVDSRKTQPWLENLKAVLGERKPDYLVVSHMEPDHGGSIAALVSAYPEMKLVGNAKTFGMMEQFFTFALDSRKVVVKEGDKLETGNHCLQFYLAPMVHWPEVMVTYETAEKILFSADAFGTFGSLAKNQEWIREARRYYINIVGKYGVSVQALLKKVSALDIKMIAPLHGPVLSENLIGYLEKYDTWSSYRPEEPGVVVAYASIHGHTAAAAGKMVELLKEKGAKMVVSFDLARTDFSRVIEAAFRYDQLVLMAASYDSGVFPPMEDFLHHLRAKAYQNRKVGIVQNGSWAPSAAKCMRAVLEGCKNVVICEPVVTIKSAMKSETVAEMSTLADELLS